MISILLYSQDMTLQALLVATLGSEFSLFQERRIDKIREAIARGQYDVLLLDLEANRESVQQELSFFDEIRASGVPLVVMTVA